jgi:DNA-binding response OmpR family regulator
MTYDSIRPRILICEDEPLIAMHLAALIEDYGCQVIGPYTSIRDARAGLRKQAVDAAVLDIELADGASTPLAAALREAGVRIIVLSGLQIVSPPPEFAGVDWLNKPVDETRLRAFCKGVHRSASQSPPMTSVAEPALRPAV